MHTPTLTVLAALLTALVTAVLYAVWHFNKNIPGLRLWVLSFLCSSVFTVSLLLRSWLPEVLGVVISQGFVALGAYLCLLAGRMYMGRRPFSHLYAVAALGALLALSVVFTEVYPHVGMRFVLMGLGSGVCYLLTTRTLTAGAFTACQRVICWLVCCACTGCSFY